MGRKDQCYLRDTAPIVASESSTDASLCRTLMHALQIGTPALASKPFPPQCGPSQVARVRTFGQFLLASRRSHQQYIGF